ncbi:MAG: hypothetical protein ACYTDY_00465 [Planctomycetota bacterium]
MAVLLLVLVAGGCKLFYPPVLSAIVLPIARPCSDTLSPSDYRDLVEGSESSLEELRIGVLRNRNRDTWNSMVEGEDVDERIDENLLLRDFLDETGLFGDVVVVDDPFEAGVDYYITCSADCMYDIQLSSWMYAWNWLLLGTGFLLGWPHQDSEASYVTEAVFYQVSEEGGKRLPVLAGASISTNLRTWYGDNIYWRPDFYGASALEPMFEQILYDFLAQSGCLE